MFTNQLLVFRKQNSTLNKFKRKYNILLVHTDCNVAEALSKMISIKLRFDQNQSTTEGTRYNLVPLSLYSIRRAGLSAPHALYNSVTKSFNQFDLIFIIKL